MSEDRRRYAPAAARNREPILSVLARHLPRRGRVLEIASGTGENVTYFAAASDPALIFQPTDIDPDARASIDAWTAARGLSNVLPAIALDATAPEWPMSDADVVLCINMIHIAPWDAAVGLIRGAARNLRPGGLLFLYGPFRRGGRHTAPSNEAFDRDLRRSDPEWGVRDLEAITALAAEYGFLAPIVEAMPANNLSVILRTSPAWSAVAAPR